VGQELLESLESEVRTCLDLPNAPRNSREFRELPPRHPANRPDPSATAREPHEQLLDLRGRGHLLRSGSKKLHVIFKETGPAPRRSASPAEHAAPLHLRVHGERARSRRDSWPLRAGAALGALQLHEQPQLRVDQLAEDGHFLGGSAPRGTWPRPCRSSRAGGRAYEAADIARHLVPWQRNARRSSSKPHRLLPGIDAVSETNTGVRRGGFSTAAAPGKRGRDSCSEQAVA
jgi:hypothetical protein